MVRQDLPPDPDAKAKWEQLPQNQPSKQALPPVAGGGRWVWGLLLLLALFVVLALLPTPPG
ncbi:MAG TPA: hypothetical protein VHO69_05115 [Phototrophicaceae bacterium]|nr:hypothetical protein [Phototrophicaceae bacterium]